MYIGESCMVRYPEGEDRFIWHHAKIKTIQKTTVSVIWMEGDYKGSETPKIPHSALFLDDKRDNIASDLAILKKDMNIVKEKLERNHTSGSNTVELLGGILKQILAKLDDLNKKVEDHTTYLYQKDLFDDDVVSYDSSLNRLADSLRGLKSSGSVEMSDVPELDDVPAFSNKKKYTSYDGNSRY